MDHIAMHDGARFVVRIGENGSARRSSEFWINIDGVYTTPEEVLAAYDQLSGAVEEIFVAVMRGAVGPVNPEIVSQAGEALTDAVDPHPH